MRQRYEFTLIFRFAFTNYFYFCTPIFTPMAMETFWNMQLFIIYITTG